MRNDNLQISEWGVDEHPTTELLRQYEEGRLPAATNYELERHLLDCELCEDMLSGMALADRNRTRQARERIWQRIRTRLRRNRRKTRALHGLGDWRVALGLLMMFISLGLLLFYHYTRTLAEQKAAVQAGEALPPTPEELLARTIDSALVLEIPAPPYSPVQPLPAAKTTDNVSLSIEVLRGRLLSPEGRGIAAAHIAVGGSRQYTSSDEAGYFSLELPAQTYTLTIQASGYQEKRLDVALPAAPLEIRLTRTSSNP